MFIDLTGREHYYQQLDLMKMQTLLLLSRQVYEVEIVPNQTGGLYSVYGRTASGVLIAAQRFVNSELTEIL